MKAGGYRNLMVALLLANAASGCAPVAADFDEADAEAVRAVEEAYRLGWLANEPDAVMAVLEPGAVIMPAGVPPIEGDSAIRAYWWPSDGSITAIVEYEISVEEVLGGADLAILRGRGSLTFDHTAPEGESARFTSNSVHLSVFRRGPDGQWLISRRTWSALR